MQAPSGGVLATLWAADGERGLVAEGVEPALVVGKALLDRTGLVNGVRIAMPLERAGQVDDGIEAIGVGAAGKADVFRQPCANPLFNNCQNLVAALEVFVAVLVADAGVTPWRAGVGRASVPQELLASVRSWRGGAGC